MRVPERQPIKTGSGADIAFAVVVLVTFFSIASNLQTASLFGVALLVGAGILYILLGIYGYAFVARSEAVALHLAYFVFQAPLGALIVYLGRGSGFTALILLPLVGHTLMLLPARWAYGVNAVIALLYVLAIALSSGWDAVGVNLPGFLAGQVFILFFTQVAVNEERARREVEKLVTELADANQQLREYAQQVEELSVSKERNRLAREIHDGLGHYLTTIHAQLQAAQAVMDREPRKAMDILHRAQTVTQEALLDVRQSVAALRQPADEGLPLPARLSRLLESSDLPGVKAHFAVLGEPRPLSAAAGQTLYRAAQEGISNTRKHARAANLWLHLDYSQPDRMRLSLRDDGVGTAAMDGGFGLLGMRERVNLLSGSVNIETAPGSGFRLEIEVPE